MIQQELKDLLQQAIAALRQEKILARDPELSTIHLERPARPEHGDFSTNLALVLAGQYGIRPQQLAGRIAEYLPNSNLVSRVETAGAGFINFFLSHTWLHQSLAEIVSQKDDYGRSDSGRGLRIQVEYGSANPTGPIHVGNARNIAYGEVLSNLLEHVGFSVGRENYLNDAGAQMRRFALSLEAAYMNALGHAASVPEDGYHGEYLIEMGKQLAGEEGMGLVNNTDEIQEWGLQRMLESHRQTVERFGVHYDHWMSERSLHESGRVEAAIEKLRIAGHTYEKDGALWFRSTEFGHTQDRVLVRSEGRGPGYLAADTAYLLEKIERGFDRLVYLWGADHHGYTESLMAVAKALGVDDRIEMILYQFVNFTRGGVPAKMSKRSGEMVSLDELLDEVGVDAARFTFLTRSIDSTMEFDFDLVKAETQENPVYYVQYAHARISSILRYGNEQGIELGSIQDAALQLLTHNTEHTLMRKLTEFPEMLQTAAKMRAPHRLTTYSRELAELFHAFYRDCRVITDDLTLTQARLWLSEATRQVLANTLSLLGVSAPERM